MTLKNAYELHENDDHTLKNYNDHSDSQIISNSKGNPYKVLLQLREDGSNEILFSKSLFLSSFHNW